MYDFNELSVNEQFARSAVSEGDYIYVGAPKAKFTHNACLNSTPCDLGKVYVFKQALDQGKTVWQKQAELISPTPELGERFGYAIAQAGDWLAISAPYRKKNITFSDGSTGTTEHGAVYMYKRDANEPSGWVYSQTLITPNESKDPHIGLKLSMTDKAIAVAAPYHPVNDPIQNIKNVGAVFIAIHTGNQTGQEWRWVMSPSQGSNASQIKRFTNGCNDDLFGMSVVMSQTPQGENMFIVGAPKASVNCRGSLTGLVFLYKQNADASWQKYILRAPQGSYNGDAFGHSLALNNDHLMVGALYAKNNQKITTGVVYDYFYNNQNPLNALNAIPYKITAQSTQKNQRFGYSMALRENNLLISALTTNEETYSPNALEDQTLNFLGEVSVFKYLAGNWLNNQVLQAPIKNTGDFFGYSMLWFEPIGLANTVWPLVGSHRLRDAAHANEQKGMLYSFVPVDHVQVNALVQLNDVEYIARQSVQAGDTLKVKISVRNLDQVTQSQARALKILLNSQDIQYLSDSANACHLSTVNNKELICDIPAVLPANQFDVTLNYKVMANSRSGIVPLDIHLDVSHSNVLKDSYTRFSRDLLINAIASAQIEVGTEPNTTINLEGLTESSAAKQILAQIVGKDADFDNNQLSFVVYGEDAQFFKCLSQKVRCQLVLQNIDKLKTVNKSTLKVSIKADDGSRTSSVPDSVDLVFDLKKIQKNSVSNQVGSGNMGVFVSLYLMMLGMLKWCRKYPSS